MQLLNINIIGQESVKHIHIQDERIRYVGNDEKLLPVSQKNEQLIFDGALAFPGLINSHDHLDFDLFPQLGNKIYQNYVEWGADIQSANKEQIDSVLRIPKHLRTKWGVYKNLLTGVVTVVHHGDKLIVEDDLINVFQECQTIHSIKRGKNWKFHLNKFYKRKQPVVVHIGEGTDETASNEIDELIKWNYFKRDIIGIHGVAMNEKQAASFKALVWCPDSNDFLFGKTAPISKLKKKVPLLFGTDSTLTASWNIWDQLRLARSKNLVTESELFDMLTVTPAATWKLTDRGRLAENQYADIVIVKSQADRKGLDAFYATNPEDILLILHHGNIRLFDSELLDQVKKTTIPIVKFSRISINGADKYVQGNLPDLMMEIRKYNPEIVFPVIVG